MKTNRREENVARALWEAEPSGHRMMKRAGFPVDWDSQPDSVKRDYYAQARVALKAANSPAKNAAYAVRYRGANDPISAMHAAFEAADNGDAPLHEYPQRAIDALAAIGYAVVPVAATEAMPEPSARANGGAA